VSKQKSKTNAIRELEQANLSHTVHEVSADGSMTGLEIAKLAGENPDCVFKTLVTVGKTNEHYVFMIPVACELDLKKAAQAAGEKSIHMIKSRELLDLTGYVHGGCSPVGMKKEFRTFIDETALLYPKIYFSAGRIGMQIEMKVEDLERIVPLTFCDLILIA
jgi:Cys-tRNA(Pro)/Cys-tRNA(Cys) deacylase